MPPSVATNGYSAVPAMTGLGVFYELLITCRGDADPNTGYFLDIKTIDRAARAAAIPAITEAFRSAARDGPNSAPDPAAILIALAPALNTALGGVLHSVRWYLSPFYSMEFLVPASPSTSATTVTIRQRFEIAAAHRLHSPALTDEQNRAMFGKCNNPSGHGHNYILEPAVALAVGPAQPPFSLAQLETLMDQTIIQPFDHKHLNVDCPEFDTSQGGLNPSVENIARVFFDRLAPLVRTIQGAQLQAMTVWETEKTSATYPA